MAFRPHNCSEQLKIPSNFTLLKRFRSYLSGQRAIFYSGAAQQSTSWTKTKHLSKTQVVSDQTWSSAI